MTVLSLFSGAGGLDLGFKQAGHKILWANDIDSYAVETYKKNIGNHIIKADIKEIDIDSLPKTDIVIGGFPCQGFSQANRFRNIEDERNHLYKFFYLTISKKQPKFFVAENVKGILSLAKGKIIKQIEQDFADAGYVVSVNVVNMADYGVPETRQRVIILGQQKQFGPSMIIGLPPKTNSKDGKLLPKWRTIKEAIDRYPDPDSENEYLNHIYSKYKVIVRDYTAHRKTDPNKPSPTILARGNGGGGVCAIPHYNGKRRLTIRESAAIQTFPDDFEFYGPMGSCYRQIGNAVPPLFAFQLAKCFTELENESSISI